MQIKKSKQEKPVNINISLNINQSNQLRTNGRQKQKKQLQYNQIKQQYHQTQQQLTFSDKIFSKQLIEGQKAKCFRKHSKIKSNSVVFNQTQVKAEQLDKLDFNFKKHKKKLSQCPKIKQKTNSSKNKVFFKNKSGVSQFVKSSRLQYGNGSQKKINKIKELKQIMKQLINTQVNKLIKQIRDSKKTIDKKSKFSKIKKNQQQKERQINIQKLKSLKQMNESLINLQKSQQQQLKQIYDIRLQTYESNELVSQIKQFQKNQQILSTNRQTIQNQSQFENLQTQQNTYRIIEGYVSIFNQIQRKSNHKNQIIQSFDQSYEIQLSQINKEVQQSNLSNPLAEKINLIKKQQQIINQPVIKKDQHILIGEIQKWKKMLEYFKNNINQDVSQKQIMKSFEKFINESQTNLKKYINNKSIPDNQKQQIIQSQVENIQRQQQFMQQQNEEDITYNSQDQSSQFNLNNNIKLINYYSIQNILRKSQSLLEQAREKDFKKLQKQYEKGRLSRDKMKLQNQKIQKWWQLENKRILYAKNYIKKGYNQVKHLINKLNQTYNYQQMNNKVMMKCLSDKYLNNKPIIISIQKQRKISHQKSSNSSEIQIDGIKQKLDSLKKYHEQHEQNSEQNQNYLQLSLNYQSLNQQIIIKESQKKQNNKNENKLDELSSLTCQDKDDIFQFIFLDVCIQVIQEPCLDNRIMKSINQHIRKLKDLKKRMKGIRTNVNVVKQYLRRFISFVISNFNLNVGTNRKVLQNLHKPMGPSPKQILRYMRPYTIQIQYPSQQNVSTVIPILMFQQFEKSLMQNVEFQRYFDNEEEEQNRIKFLKNILHIHNKAIFDALNQILDYRRPYGIWGIPFPWKATINKIHHINDSKLQVNPNIIQNELKDCSERVVDCCAYVCGLIRDKQQSLVGSANISDQYIQTIKQDRLARLLAADVNKIQQS